MWWSPRDDNGFGLARAVEGMLAGYRVHVTDRRPGTPQLVWGVGSAPDVRGVWRHPLALVSYEALTSVGVEIRPGRYPVGQVRDLAPHAPVLDLLASWGLDDDALVDVTTRP